VTRLEGLAACSILRNLQLYSNKISRLENLQKLTSLQVGCRHSSQLKYDHRNVSSSPCCFLTPVTCLQQPAPANTHALQVLNLSENCITTLSGLPPLPQLRDVNLAANPVSELCSQILELPRLTALNLSATCVSSFRALWQLSACPSLEHLVLDDPLWGAAPLARLGNYRSSAVRQLQKLAVLDHALVSKVEISFTSPLPPGTILVAAPSTLQAAHPGVQMVSLQTPVLPSQEASSVHFRNQKNSVGAHCTNIILFNCGRRAHHHESHAQQ